MTDRPKPDKLEAALAAGQLWRVKEILAGRIGSLPFDPDRYEQFGRVLLQMGDDLQAGKFLFLSGVRKPEYQGAIDLFLRRSTRGGWRSLLGTFPASARGASWADLPVQLRDDLREAGVPPRPESEAVWAVAARKPIEAANVLGCFAVIVALVVVGLLISLAITYFL